MLLTLVPELLLFSGLVVFTHKRLLRYLRYYQQEEYSPRRFVRWLKQNRAFDSRGCLIAAFGALCIVVPSAAAWIAAVQGIAFAVIGVREVDPRNEGKKKLVLTQRAKTIFVVALVFLLIGILGIVGPSTCAMRALALMVVAQFPPFALIAAVIFLIPREKALQNSLKAEAHEKFVSINPFSIGVTGSFGKTSVKNLLGEILQQSLGSTFWPQAGVNTEMGITREIREKMNRFDRFAVIEMGAYHRGSIAKLCRLTPVKAGIVTAVHLMHLERFGSEEDIYRAKSELPQHVPAEGILVLNGDNPGARRMATEFPKKTTLLYGLDSSAGPLDARLADIVVRKDGTSFVIHWRGEQYVGFTRMHGRGALSNILGCFTMACSLGADAKVVLAVVQNITPVSNRLEVKDYGSYIQINDAYNSNPQGFRYALEVLKELPGKRRILMTPGMIELGDKSFEENRAVAQLAAAVCDLVIVVNRTNREAWSVGLNDGKLTGEAVQYFETRDEALAYFNRIRGEGDILLLENDLPDLLEFSEVF